MPAPRREKAYASKRMVFNNDGCDVLYFPADLEPTAENLLAQRTTALAGTHVDALSYCTISSGFSQFTHKTLVGEVLTKNPGRDGRCNIAQTLIDQGRDCLQIMVDFGHQNHMEVFWSMRMNDTHDGSRPQDGSDHFLFPRLKREHPEFLLGRPDENLPGGKWSGVNYACPEIRELAYLFVEEVCQNYDIDGVELDFFRHPAFFPSSVRGIPAAAKEREAMTELMRRIAGMIARAGEQRNRPIQLAVRTPDSTAYCAAIGLDLERWLAEGLVDHYIPSGYFQLNPWSYSTALGQKYGVKVYAGMSESRVGGGHHRDPGRSSDACYRARALNAWDAGCDGIYMFNLFDPHRPLWRELGDPDQLRRQSRRYFVSYRGRKRAAGGNLAYDDYWNLPALNPDDPVTLRPGIPYQTELVLSGPPADQQAVSAVLTIRFAESCPPEVDIRFNGCSVEATQRERDTMKAAVSPALLGMGAHPIEVTLPQTGPEVVLLDLELKVSGD